MKTTSRNLFLSLQLFITPCVWGIPRDVACKIQAVLEAEDGSDPAHTINIRLTTPPPNSTQSQQLIKSAYGSIQTREESQPTTHFIYSAKTGFRGFDSIFMQYETDGKPGHFIYLEKDRTFQVYRYNNKNYKTISVSAACEGLGYRQINYQLENQWTEDSLELQMGILPAGGEGYARSTYVLPRAGFISGVSDYPAMSGYILQITYLSPTGEFVPCLTKSLFPLVNGIGYLVKVKTQGSSSNPVIDCRLEGF